MAAKWWRYNSTSHIFEQSLDEGTTWTIPPLNASIITEGVFDPARLGGSLAFTNVANIFSKKQTIAANDTDIAALDFHALTGAVNLRQWRILAWSDGKLYFQHMDDASNATGSPLILGRPGFIESKITVTGGSETSTLIHNSPIEIIKANHPRVGFHWPGVVASSIGMDASGYIRTYNNPGTDYERFLCKNLYAVSNNNTMGDLTVLGGTNFVGGVLTTGGNIIGQAGYFQMLSVLYPGRVDIGVMQASWYLGTHASWGLYTNTGIYVVGPVIGQVYNNHGGYYGFIKSHALTYTNPNALDDYEEGEWTPTVEFDSGEAEYTERNASYTKIGRLVFVAGKVVLSSKGTGKARVIDLPFIPEHRVSGPRYIPDLEVNQPAYFEFSYQAPT